MQLFTKDVPSGASFSYFVSLDVLKTPFIFTAANISHPTTAIKYKRRSGLRTVNRHVKPGLMINKYLSAQTTEKSVPETLESVHKIPHHLPSSEVPKHEYREQNYHNKFCK